MAALARLPVAVSSSEDDNPRSPKVDLERDRG
jgi:hypothetical protein